MRGRDDLPGYSRRLEGSYTRSAWSGHAPVSCPLLASEELGKCSLMRLFSESQGCSEGKGEKE